VGNQPAVLSAARRESLTAVETHGIIDLLRGASPEQEQFILLKPREALVQADGVAGPLRDPRLSPSGNRVARQLRFLFDALAGMENWLRFPGLVELKHSDRVLLLPRFERLEWNAQSVAALVDDLLLQVQLSEKPNGREALQRDCATLAGADAQAADRPRTGPGRIERARSDCPLAAEAFGCRADLGAEAAGVAAEPTG
jgi:hypothetical protein